MQVHGTNSVINLIYCMILKLISSDVSLSLEGTRGGIADKHSEKPNVASNGNPSEPKHTE